MKRSLVLAVIAIAIALGVAGCAGTDTDSQTAAQFNDADVTFAQQMIPHHRQAKMAKQAEQRAAAAEVKNLATQIEKAQDPEIQTMTSWLQAWGREVPEGTAHTGHGGTDVPGMMSDREMSALQDASGAAFDRMFLQMMIRHHQGAIDLARTEQADGRYPDATALAEQIEAAQTTEIAVMNKLLGS